MNWILFLTLLAQVNIALVVLSITVSFFIYMVGDQIKPRRRSLEKTTQIL